jgi:type VI secretion system secreted protein Hcp
MATDYFLAIDGIKGESKDHKHAGEIEVMSFSWGATQSGSFAHGGGGGAGKVSFQDFHFVMSINKSSPLLLQQCADGTHIKSAVLTVRKAGKEQQEYLKVKMEDVLISSYQTGGSTGGGDVPTDQVSLNFAKINFSYADQKADGTLASPTVATWDLKTNKK